MIWNYFKIAWRNLSGNKLFTFINVFGLAVGLATCLLITLYILDELSFDKHHKDADRICRVASRTGSGNDWAALAAPVAWGIKREFPEVQQVTRVLKFPDLSNVLMRYNDSDKKKQFFEKNGYYADSTFFQLFTYSFLYGNEDALHAPNTMVVSRTIAEKFFDNTDPVGKTVTLALPFGEFDYTVTGVFDDTKNNSHIPASFFLSMRNSDAGRWVNSQTNWANNSIFHTYVKLKSGYNLKNFEEKLKPFYNRRAGADLKASGFLKSLYIQPLKDIYLRSSIDGEIGVNGNIKYLYVLGSIAMIIMIIACMNFMNLSTARSESSSREVGVRKVMGAFRSSLVCRFLSESLMLTILAVLVAIVLAWFFLPMFNTLTEKELRLAAEPKLIIILFGLTLFTGLLSGLYPAFYLSSFKPILVLKGKVVNHFSAALIRKGLVVFQFAISVCLIFAAIVIVHQLHYVQNKQLGFKKEQQIVLPLQSGEVAKNYAVLKNELLNHPDVKNVTSGSAYPGIEILNEMLFYAEGKSVHDNVDIRMSSVETDFFETLGLTILHGRSFSEKFTADSNSIVLNETAVRRLGYKPETAVGKKIYYDWQNRTNEMQIVGVVKNFHYESLHKEIRPFAFSVNNFFANKYNYVIVNVGSSDYDAVLDHAEKSWSSINAGTPFTFSFIDQDFQKNYEKEKRASGIVITFTTIAIILACLGLFGLAVFSAEQRTKEIGIRKVLGAAQGSIVVLLSRDYLRLIPISLLVALPAGWLIMNMWLQNFVYRISISWWMFVLAGGMAVLIAFITISYQSVKSAFANPLKCLRTE